MKDMHSARDPAGPAGYHPAIEDPLVAAGIVLQFAADFIPIVGGIISTVIGLLWPKRQQDAWEQIKEKVKALVDEEIDDEEWNNLQFLINEFKDKVSEFSSALAAGNYESAKMTYTALTGYFIGIDERFKIAGHKVSYVFSPLYCLTVSLILSFRLESIHHASQLKLDQQLIEAEKTKLHNLLSSAIDHLNTVADEHTKYVSDELNLLDAGESANDENVKNINSVFQFNRYYLMNVIVFTQIWKTFHQSCLIKNTNVVMTFPGIAAGVFYKIENFQPIALSGIELAKIITPASEEAVIVGATLYDSVEIRDDYVRPTAAKVDYTDHQDAMGYFGQPDDMQVAAHTVTFDVKNYDYLNSLSASMFGFVGHITLTSAKGSSVSAGKQNDPNLATLTLDCPYRIALIYVPSDEVGYTYLQSGHQMTGMACGVVYDNKLAAAYANQSLEKLAAK